MRCSQAREALSAWYDGERADANPAAVATHAASCDRCTAFQRALGAVADLVDSREVGPDLALTVPGSHDGPAVRSWVLLGLRLAIGLAGVVALLPALAEALGHTDHEAHESLSFTVAVSVALICAAARPGLARGYLPVIGAVSVLLVVTSAIDVDEGRIALSHEVRHLSVLVGFVLVAMMVLRDSRDARDRSPRLRRPRSGQVTQRSVVTRLGRSALPALSGTLLAALVLLVGPPASAHAMLESSTPAADTVLQEAPASVGLVFNEDVTLLPDSVRVFGPDGTQVDNGSVARAHGDSATAEVGVRSDLPDGTYLVSYRVVSADSHPVEGAYTFVVGHPSRAPAAAPVTTDGGSGSIDVALGFSRWLSYAGSALGLGGFGFLVWCWPAGWASRRARLLVDGGVGALAVGTLLALLLKGPYDAGLGLGSVSDGALLREVLRTTYGRALDIRLFLIAALVLLLTYREHLPRRWLVPTPAVLLVGVGVTFALCGHAAAGSDRPIAVASDTAHVGAMSLWLGGLVLLLGAVLVRGSRRDVVTPTVLRFSTLASGAVLLLIATGVYQTLREVRSYDVLLHTHYGHVLLVKLGIVALAFFAAAGSRAWVWQTTNPVVPVHAATTAPPEPVVDGRPQLRRLRTTVGLETTMLVGVLVATAMLVTSDPAVSVPPPRPVSANLTVGPDHVRVSTVPDGAHRVQLMLQVTDAAGKPTEPREVDASLRLDASKIGPLPVTLTRMGRGGRMGTVSVPIPGDWQLAVTVRTSAIDEATAYVDVPIE
ncbi:MAG TPA: copper resistance protein CopC [Nocardioides sp.]|uniref:copper resistance protein CopC n=1 Tax=Nocardioides sp. TaxID=35761 RepID=UPI002F41B160